MSKKLRILCLHGYMQNATNLRAKTGALRKQLSKLAEFEFIDAPYDAQDANTNTASNDGIQQQQQQQSTQPEGRKLTWWKFHQVKKQAAAADNNNNNNNREEEPEYVYEGWQETLQYLHDAFRTKGPFDGIMGFSQGACLAALLCANAHHNSNNNNNKKKKKKTAITTTTSTSGSNNSSDGDVSGLPLYNFDFRFAILVGAFLPRAQEVDKYFNMDSTLIRIPSLHVMGKNDDIITVARSMQVHAKFEPALAEVYQHEHGHLIPSDKSAIEVYKKFLQKMLDDGASSAPAPSS